MSYLVTVPLLILLILTAAGAIFVRELIGAVFILKEYLYLPGLLLLSYYYKRY